MSDKLSEMVKDPIFSIELGKAAEYLVCADIILHGYRCYPSDQGLPYDLVIDVDGRLLRVQVKSASYAKNCNAKGRAERIAYTYNVRARGRSRKGRLSDRHCDLVAFVALDTRQIAYLALKDVGQTVQLAPSNHEFRGRFSRKRWSRIDSLPLGEALKRFDGGSDGVAEKNRGQLFFNGEWKTLTEWAKIYDNKVSRISWRLARGWTVERALKEQPSIGWSRQLRAREDGGARA